MNTFPAVAALAIVYGCGYVTGSLLVAPKHDRTSVSIGIVRLLSGLLLTSIAFLLSLELSLPWFSGPLVLFALAVMLNRGAAFAFPHPALSFGWNGALAATVAIIVLAPPVISALRMAPGDFPPVYFNVDVPYFLEKVHSLVGTQTFPPESLSVADGRRPYHFGLHGIAAFVSRGSGLAPHKAVFLILVPLLAAGTGAAASVLARALSPALPSLVAIPLLLIPVPTLWYDFWRSVVPRLQDAIATESFGPLASLTANWEAWSVAPNIQNLAGHFLVLASLGAIVSAPSLGWRLPSFLIGSAILFKSPAGVALMAGFGLAQAYRAAMARSLKPLMPVIAATAVFALVYGAFWVLLPIPPELKAEFSPFFYLEFLIGNSGLHWFLLDVAWLLLPALLILPARLGDPERHSLPLLAFAVAPFLVVNVLRLVDLRRDFGISSMNEDDWRQIMIPVPILLHAFVVSVVGRRWTRLGAGLRTACVLAVMLVALPPVFVAARYAQVLVEHPEQGHEFADNRALADALAAIPVDGALIVTNDLRYPADGFRRDNRQMQIPSLFGHRAFAVNYVYEAYAFSQERLELQKLLEANQWSPDIDEAARANGWTHLLIHKAFTHPVPVPLERVFDNDMYSVYRFPPR